MLPEDVDPVVPDVPELLDVPVEPPEDEGRVDEPLDDPIPEEEPEVEPPVLGEVLVAPDEEGEVLEPVEEAPVLPDVPDEEGVLDEEDGVLDDGETLPVAEPLADPMPDAEPELDPEALGLVVLHAANANAQAIGRINFFI